jgi:hypothetical protein
VSLAGLGRTVVVLLVVAAAFQGLIALVDLGYINVLEQFLEGEVAPSEVEDVQAGIGALYLLSTLIQVVLAGLFIAWFHRAYKNLERTSVAELRYSTGWAIGGWFIPVFNWIRPKQIVNDVWRAGESGAEVRDGSWRSRPVAPLVHWWWGAWIASTILYAAGSVLSGGSGDVIAGREEIESEQTATSIEAVAALLGVAAAILAVRVVRRLTSRGDELRAAVLAGEGEPEGPGAAAPAPVVPPPEPGATETQGQVRCPVCGWVFRDGAALRRHLEAHHPGDEPGGTARAS